MKYSACVEMLFVEAGEVPARIRAAAAAGIEGVEFWRHSNKDIDAVEAALRDTGIALTGILAEPITPLTDPARHGEFLEGLARSIDVARRLGAPALIAQAGPELPGVPRAPQHDAVVAALSLSAERLRGSGVTLVLEPLNTLVDHAGYFLPSTREGLDIVDEVGRPEVRLIYDIYHSAVMGERTEEVLRGRLDRVAHVHLADAPGRHEPGSGTMDWRQRLAWLNDTGYDGWVGLEYRPTGPTVASLQALLGA